MVTFLAGVSGLTAACLVVTESKHEPEPVRAPLPRGMEKTVMVLCRNPGLVMTGPVQWVKIQLIVGPVHTTPEGFEIICLRKTRSVKSHYSRDIIAFVKLRF